jgi:hypothetical protein
VFIALSLLCSIIINFYFMSSRNTLY